MSSVLCVTLAILLQYQLLLDNNKSIENKSVDVYNRKQQHQKNKKQNSDCVWKI